MQHFLIFVFMLVFAMPLIAASVGVAASHDGSLSDPNIHPNGIGNLKSARLLANALALRINPTSPGGSL